MPVVDVNSLPIVEPRPGWRGRFFQSAHMTFAYYAIAPDATVHEHKHDEEEIWHVLEGELEVSPGETAGVVQPGQAVVVPGGTPHRVRALGPCRVIVVDHPVRTSVGGIDIGSQTDAR